MAKFSEQLDTFFDRVANKEDVAKLFEALKKALAEATANLSQNVTSNRDEMASQVAEITTSLEALESRVSDALGTMKNGADSALATLRAALQSEIQAVKDLIPELPPEFDASHLESRIAEVEGKIPAVQIGEDYRNHLEALSGDDRLDKSAVKGIETIEEEVRTIALRPSSVGGAKGIGLYVNGAKKLLTAQTINLIPGSGISLTYAHTNGRNDITISATGSGAFAVLAATGTINDSNTTFTFDTEPVIVVVNGASYVNGAGVTITGTTAELDNPVGTGGNLYGIG